ncbi:MULTISPECIES: dioxygenase family protein [unclassified Sphingomonas]|uniref:dioxygenase family protein n=1 Tax=unclassified Sphingomonas TaxID=196159 RepID=UPI0006F4B24A|nr:MULTISPECIES: intradiol ring-cleavage dioxygenase [unclassified Sphingomonas]KQM66297.1 intradiol ring-cleavage dioxygenase [Sphingomonas sp. Leaf16]KQN08753.1 intradiol ring-cleavage dioxygenase [Sphingomonas sp. Leaf29]KQN17334.1 intradiol ring-cleavage dioxygenase [Sphingomonas sp. Leaf32]
MPQKDAAEDHDLGLVHDLKVIAAMADRRSTLRLFAGVGTAALLGGCGSDSSGSSSGTVTTTATPTPTPTPTPTATATTTPTGACLVDPTETAGPYPADGTNTSSGSTSNVLTASGVVRSDIRSSFLNGSTTTASGVALKLTLTVVNVNAACAPLAGYLVYLWHCDAQGRYSLYDMSSESWLRGALVTDANGQVTFTTIFPGCYAGRFPHMHFEVFSSAAVATGGRYASLTSQLAMPTAACSAIYSGSALYSSSVANYSRVSTASDNVFGDNTTAQIAQQTPTLTGSAAEGYVGTAIIGLAR